jgi:ribosomal protein S21
MVKADIGQSKVNAIRRHGMKTQQEVQMEIENAVRKFKKRTHRLENLIEVFVPFAQWSDAQQAKGRKGKLTLADFLAETEGSREESVERAIRALKKS